MNFDRPLSSFAVEVRSLVHDSTLESVHSAHVPFDTSPFLMQKRKERETVARRGNEVRNGANTGICLVTSSQKSRTYTIKVVEISNETTFFSKAFRNECFWSIRRDRNGSRLWPIAKTVLLVMGNNTISEKRCGCQRNLLFSSVINPKY